ncbi:hypothetical protein GCM10018793_44700 [Streptomyces sulfonofaciens]|uniref:Ankyrin repeat domain-containing protein n=1 Tax=Streptomyces sulfonofaciens TaxID=68272 RepID=A0A919L5A5_9ACTN|nr:ankyrin repeat domain-containing protein [Streptomyces sulfonofaciens]GHH83201.1 hypothetical protein GCM10018793_44700 [Streptomyces sulfonofaciens]
MSVFLVVLCGVVSAACAWLGYVLHRRRRVTAFHDAVRAGDLPAVRLWVANGQDVNARGRRGDTALHVAHYAGDEAAVEQLEALGADDELRNEAGFTPRRMADVRGAESVLEELSHLLDPHRGWRDAQRARLLYDRLRVHRHRVTTHALANVAARAPSPRTVLLTAIKLGNRSHLPALDRLLHVHGTKALAEDYLNSGSPFLEAAAQRWARRHNYTIVRGGGRGAAASWGRF